LGRNRFDQPIHALCGFIDVMPDKQGNVFAPLAQRRNAQGEDIQSVKQITPELAVFDHLS
jgi:hypothetical protein